MPVHESIPSHISYGLHLREPNLALVTASSSPVALHLACKSIGDGECPLEFVGGVNAIGHNERITKRFIVQNSTA